MPDNDSMTTTTEKAMIGELRKVLKRLHYPLEVMLVCVRWYVAYPLSLRHIEEMIAKSAVFSLTTPRYIAGRSRGCRCWQPFFEDATSVWEQAIDTSGANTASIESVKADACVGILLRQCKYLINIVEQDHRAIKRITRPMLGFK